jgi:hypothetical protein
MEFLDLVQAAAASDLGIFIYRISEGAADWMRLMEERDIREAALADRTFQFLISVGDIVMEYCRAFPIFATG